MKKILNQIIFACFEESALSYPLQWPRRQQAQRVERYERFLKLLIILLGSITLCSSQGLPLFYWKHKKFINFGDYISLKLVERIVGGPIREYQKDSREKKFLAIGSIISFAQEGDVVWGSGIKRDDFDNISYNFIHIDIRAIRGPLSRAFLTKQLNITCPEIYGDPALLIPYFFPEFQKSKHPHYEYIIIPHYSEQFLFPKDIFPNAVYPTDPWDEVIQKIVDSKFVIAGSLHGIIVAEAFGIPARLLRRCTKDEPLFKYQDYYFGTGRSQFTPACSIEQALTLGGEPPIKCNLKKLYEAFPFDYFPSAQKQEIDFERE